MKPFLNVLFFLFLGLMAQAQPINITISGTLTDANGQPVPGIDIHIFTDSLPGLDYYNTVQTDAQGYYSDSFTVAANFTQGAVYVSYNCNGQYVLATTFWSPPQTNLILNLSYCEGVNPVDTLCNATVYIQFDSVGTGVGLKAIASGAVPFAYHWSTGETTASIVPGAPGLYSVTVTDAEGCEAQASYYWNTVIDTFCYVTIYPIQGGSMLQADASGTPPFAYSWLSGQSSPAIFINGPGEYCVVVTDATGCVSTACYTVPPAESYGISGTVYEQDSSNLNSLLGYVYLIQYDPVEGALTAIDTTELVPLQGGAYYTFGDVPAGDYLVKAALSEDSPGYANNLPTYYGNVLWWDEATTISIPYPGQQFFPIILLPGDNPGGPGFIGGSVSDGANFQPGQVDYRDGDPISGVSVILLDEFGQPVGYDYTDEAGSFAFPNLEWGTYKVVVELLNYEQQYYIVTIGPDNPSESGLRFEVTEEGVVGAKTPVVEQSITVYPVPAGENIQLAFTSEVSGPALFLVADYSGRILLHQQATLQVGLQNVAINLSGLPVGVYTVVARAEKQLLTRRFVKR